MRADRARDGAVTTYEYRDGRLAAERRPDGRWTYAYDAAGQLTGVRHDDGRSWTWTYDACGRRVVQTSPTGRDRFSYDAAGRLVEAVHKGATSAVTLFRYDAAGRRTHEIRGEPGRLRRPGIAGTGWAGCGRYTGRGCAPGRDHELELGPSGELRSIDGPPLDGLEWLHHRTLDLATGSFLSPDPLPGVPGSAVCANRYHYAANDPIGLSDPLGLRPMTDADLERMRESASRPAWQKAYDSVQDLVDHPIDWAADHWETVAAAGLVVVGGVLVATGVGAPIGAGILVGAGMAFSTQVALTGEVDQRSLLVSTAAGAIGGGVGGATSAMAVGSQVAVGAGTDMALSAGAQYATAGTVDPQQVVFDGVFGARPPASAPSSPGHPSPHRSASAAAASTRRSRLSSAPVSPERAIRRSKPPSGAVPRRASASNRGFRWITQDRTISIWLWWVTRSSRMPRPSA